MIITGVRIVVTGVLIRVRTDIVIRTTVIIVVVTMVRVFIRACSRGTDVRKEVKDSRHNNSSHDITNTARQTNLTKHTDMIDDVKNCEFYQ